MQMSDDHCLKKFHNRKKCLVCQGSLEIDAGQQASVSAVAKLDGFPSHCGIHKNNNKYKLLRVYKRL